MLVRMFTCCIVASMSAISGQAVAQVHLHGGHVQPHIDHHDHVIQDSHGHNIGVQHHDVLHGGSHGIGSPIISGGHIDHHDHVIQDSHGHNIGVQHHDVVHQGWSHVVPSNIHGHSPGQYYVQGNQYFYSPSPAAVNGGRYTSAKPAVVPFGGFNQTEDLSGRLETLLNDLLLDLHYNYRHNRGFAETYGEAYQLLDVAKYIHAAEHNNDRQAMRSKLGGTDQLFHHVQEDVRGWSRHHQRQIGQLGIITKMELIEATLHHLMNDVGVSGAEGGPQQAPPPASGPEQAPPPPGYSTQGNASLGHSAPPPTLP
ncbi:hypothetical protein [Novipirellula artificiosorum]|uniref:Uncharacterized protein n=1 Tax=Novipirellula artificiosorum TaxID=2528016 RepID=A0A5C6DU22_9BACT|nr:hypothetical protein [Novipirellula artificiosorum]TWU39407.1 hypothetical protein Poly41_22310 [Novipirellula artificiosorum]